MWWGRWKLPDYGTISFANIGKPIDLEACLPNLSLDEVSLVYSNGTAPSRVLSKEPLPVPMSELHVPLTNGGQDEDSPGGWYDYNVRESDSDFNEFASKMNITTTCTGFSLQLFCAQRQWGLFSVALESHNLIMQHIFLSQNPLRFHVKTMKW